ncbi:hypothetical protein [Cellulosimicrobium protaetiae]|uniref:Uncharacterized protein n=1 Tax=Cellulosimicrobium protaetiae TaxID=2587808 RepID=A0A6M5UL77_9MICO|nr:hypothetical protein [Cellulosimicrobium protaetiae]QJW38744.1 hypothetical protein FIC82_020385 [Cellulosimicrobium protaetiae]
MAATTNPHQTIARPRVIVEPINPNDRHTLFRARCEHCPWVSGKSVKTWVEGTEARLQPHRPPRRQLALAVEVVRENPDVTGARLADELTRRGRPVSTRSGQRYRARALDALAETPVS